jgi:antitoxin MazE
MPPTKTNLCRLAKWGNSLTVRLPQAIVEALKLKEGDEIQMTVAGAHHIEIARDVSSREQALARLRRYRGRLPAGFKSDRDEANSRT